MSVADFEKAGEVVAKFHDLLIEHRRHSEVLSQLVPSIWDEVDPSRRQSAAEVEARRAIAAVGVELLQLQPLVEDIAEEIDPNESPDRFKENTSTSVHWSWEGAMRATLRLLGRFRDAETRAAIFGPKGPLLAASQLHPWVWNAAVDRWDSGHWTDAVAAAARAVEELTQQKMNQSSLSGSDLYSKSFSTKPPEPGKPRLRFDEIAGKSGDGKTSSSWLSAHEGAGAFGRGCAQGIRNVLSHGTVKLSEQQAIEYLAALSVLARWVDNANVVEASPSAKESNSFPKTTA